MPADHITPILGLGLAGIVLALGPLAWIWVRHRDVAPGARLRALTVLTLFLTFDLVIFGAFTRLTDSGLGCPDWPGCYGHASPVGAQGDIVQAQLMLPYGPVTPAKAWVEMVHRYLATGVGVLIIALLVAHVAAARRGVSRASPAWAAATLGWVCLQGLFGALTVTMKLYPAIVTAHLLGGIGLLILLAVQVQRLQPEGVPLTGGLTAGAVVLAGLSAVQIALGGWVSTHYAVLACSDFPTCQGSWWPAMDFGQGFSVLRELGAAADGSYLPFTALTAIHYVHRLGAYVVLAGIALYAWRLRAHGGGRFRRWALAAAGIGLWQLASGLSNVLLGWPLIGAVAHTAGAAAWAVWLTVLLARAHHAAAPTPASGAVGSAADTPASVGPAQWRAVP